MKKASLLSLSVALVQIAWAVNGLLVRDAAFLRLRRNRELPTALSAASGRRKSSNFQSSAQNVRRGRHSRRFVRGRSEDNEFSFLQNFRSAEEINAWMEKLAEEKARETLKEQHKIFASWSSRQETRFIRNLRDREAYAAIVLFVEHFGRRNVFVYTAAIASLASSNTHQEKVFDLLNEMDLYNVRPSPYTFSALFQAMQGPKEATGGVLF